MHTQHTLDLLCCYRFQLFGDTVNTASRMESTCKAGRIQVSETTGSCLIDAGKDSWLEVREDLVGKFSGATTMQFTAAWLSHPSYFISPYSL